MRQSQFFFLSFGRKNDNTWEISKILGANQIVTGITALDFLNLGYKLCIMFNAN